MEKISLQAFKETCSNKKASVFILSSENQPQLFGSLQYSLRFSEYVIMPEYNTISFNNEEKVFVRFSNVTEVRIIEEIPDFGVVFTIVCVDNSTPSPVERFYKFIMR